MLTNVRNWLWDNITDWLNGISKKNQDIPFINNFDHMMRDLRVADVILFEGRSRVSEVIKIITLSPWTHAAIYIGPLNEIKDPAMLEIVKQHYEGDPAEPLVIESLLGYGTIVNPLTLYAEDNLRICRPDGLSDDDQEKVVHFATEHLGISYDVRQIVDLARFLFPYAILPREWRSSLFQHNAGKPTAIVCSSMIARCFQSVCFPILPVVENKNKEHVVLRKRNFRLVTPTDFDYSPYFKVIKFPHMLLTSAACYRSLPWDHNDDHRLVKKPSIKSKIFKGRRKNLQISQSDS